MARACNASSEHSEASDLSRWIHGVQADVKLSGRCKAIGPAARNGSI